MTGRFAPSPSGDLHVGNLRTALAAWLSARAAGERFLVRMDDLDPSVSVDRHGQRQLDDLAAVGVDWDGTIVRQRDRFTRYHEVTDELTALGLTYPCFCSRREIREAVRAPHDASPDGAYPGTCRDLSDAEIARRSETRPPALRLRTDGASRAVDDEVAGTFVGTTDDFVIRRNDGVPAYNLAVVLDDWDQGVTQVVRGDDLLSSTPRHLLLQELLDAPTPRYAHVPLVLGPDGDRLSKRDGAVTLADLAERDVAPSAVRHALLRSLGIPTATGDVEAAIDAWRAARRDPGRRPLTTVTLDELEREWSPSPDAQGRAR